MGKSSLVFETVFYKLQEETGRCFRQVPSRTDCREHGSL